MFDSKFRKWLWDLRCRLGIRERSTQAFRRTRSLLTRRSEIKNYLQQHQISKLQVGCGKNHLNNWLNTDLFLSGGVIYLDATKPLPFRNNSLDYIFTEHVFEHINYHDGFGFLKEARRVLKPGGRIRISTPDLSFLIRLYNEPDADISKNYIKHAIDSYVEEPKVFVRSVVINNFFYSWGHRFIYDYETLSYALQTAGFEKMVRFQPFESDDPNLQNLEAHGKTIGEEFNMLESMVVEAHKT